MLWHPPFSPSITLLLVLAGAAVMALSFLITRKHVNVLSPLGLATIGLRGLGFLVLLFILLQPHRLPAPRTQITHRTFAVLLDTSGSMSVPDGADKRSPSRLETVTRLLAEHRVFSQVETAEAKLAVYQFDAQPTPVKVDAISNLRALGKQTDLAAAVEQVAQRHQSDDLAGMLVFTDGRNTQGADPRAAAKKLKTPLFFLPIGREYRPDEVTAEVRKDLAIDSVSAAPRVILGRAVQVAVSVRATGYDARQVSTELLENDQVLSRSSVAVSKQQPKRQAIFTLKPSSLGTHTYQVRLPVTPEDGDTDLTNNLASFKIEVVDPINRLLYLDRLRNERKFLKQVLDGQRNLRFTAIVQQDEKHVLAQGNDPAMKQDAATLSAEQLRGLKAVIIGDLPAAALTEAQIASLAAWVDQGGSLLLLAGPASLGDAGFSNTALAKMLPVTISGSGGSYLEQEYRVALTPDGAAHPAFQKVAQNWVPTLPLLSIVRVQGPRPAATTLIQQQSAPYAPVCVSQSYGHGKVAVVLTDSTWRWQLGYTRLRGSGAAVSEHAVFWQQMIDWLMPQLQQKDQDGGAVQLITDRTEYEVNQPVVMLASVRGADGTVLKQAAVEFVVAAPDGRPIQRQGVLDAGAGEGAAAHRASFDAYAAGEYAIQVQAKVDGRVIGTDEAHIRVVQPLVEFAQTDPDLVLIKDLAEASNGKVLDAAALDQLATLAKLAPRKVIIQPAADEEAEPVWNRWWVLTLFVILMASEWLLRRRNQWV